MWLGHGAVPKGIVSAFHSERKILRIPEFPSQGSSCPPLPAAFSQLQVPGSGKTLPVNTLTFCTKTFEETLWWSLIIHIGSGHDVVTLSEFILYLQPAEGLSCGAVLV